MARSLSERPHIFHEGTVVSLSVDQAHETIGMGERETATWHRRYTLTTRKILGPQVAVTVAFERQLACFDRRYRLILQFQVFVTLHSRCLRAVKGGGRNLCAMQARVFTV